MRTDTEVAQRLTDALRAKAGAVTVTDERFDPERPGAADLGGVAPGAWVVPGARRGRHVRLAAAALLLVGLLAAGVVVVGSGEPTTTADAGPGAVRPLGQEQGAPQAFVVLASGTLELHQEGGGLLCLRPSDGDDLSCGDGLTSNLVIDDTWYVAVAQADTAAAPIIARGWGDPPFAGDPGMLSLEDRALPTETGADDGWSFALATPPADVESVWLRQGLANINLPRPT